MRNYFTVGLVCLVLSIAFAQEECVAMQPSCSVDLCDDVATVLSCPDCYFSDFDSIQSFLLNFLGYLSNLLILGVVSTVVCTSCGVFYCIDQCIKTCCRRS